MPAASYTLVPPGTLDEEGHTSPHGEQAAETQNRTLLERVPGPQARHLAAEFTVEQAPAPRHMTERDGHADAGHQDPFRANIRVTVPDPAS